MRDNRVDLMSGRVFTRETSRGMRECWGNMAVAKKMLAKVCQGGNRNEPSMTPTSDWDSSARSSFEEPSSLGELVAGRARFSGAIRRPSGVGLRTSMRSSSSSSSALRLAALDVEGPGVGGAELWPECCWGERPNAKLRAGGVCWW
jgi:hypothetical protein